MPWANDRIRIVHYGGIKERLIGKVVDGRRFNITEDNRKRLKEDDELEDTETLNLHRATNYKQHLSHYYDEALNGLQSYFLIIYSNNGAN